MPKPNVGETDRIIRIILGFGIVLVGLLNESWWALAGLYFIATGMMEYCFIYNLLGISTVPKKPVAANKSTSAKKTSKRKK